MSLSSKAFAQEFKNESEYLKKKKVSLLFHCENYNSSPEAPREFKIVLKTHKSLCTGNYFLYLLMLILQDMKLVGTC